MPHPNTEPAITATTIAGLIHVAIAGVRLMDWLPWTNEYGFIVIGLALHIAAGLWIRTKSTPHANPKDVDGTSLVRPNGDKPLEVQRSERRA